YLALAPSCTHFTTVEGAADLAALATATLGRLAPHARVVNASFDDALDDLLSVDRRFDFVFIDGSKEGHGTLRWIERLLPSIPRGGLIVVDDIHFSPRMEHAWRRLEQRAGLQCLLDLGRLGVCVRGDERDHPTAYDVFRVAGVNLPVV